jgi:hypothetical protein
MPKAIDSGSADNLSLQYVALQLSEWAEVHKHQQLLSRSVVKKVINSNGLAVPFPKGQTRIISKYDNYVFESKGTLGMAPNSS